MPIYEYTCQRCGDFEVTQRISDEPIKRCPTCKGRVTKLISRSTFHLKGSGWYMTDYAKNGPSSSNDSAKETKTDAKDTAKSESSPKDTGSAKTSSSKKENAVAT